MELTPDTLQDLCIFYCVEHLQHLNLHCDRDVQPHFENDGVHDTKSYSDPTLSTTLCDKLLERYLNTFLQCHRNVPQIDSVLHSLLKKAAVKGMHLSLLRCGVLSESNICDISNSHIMNVNLFGCNEYSFVNRGIEMLMKHNRLAVKSLRICGEFRQFDGGEYFSLFPTPVPGTPGPERQVVPGQESQIMPGPRSQTAPGTERLPELIFILSRIEGYVLQVSPKERSDATRANQEPSAYDQTVQNALNEDFDEETIQHKEQNWYSFPNLQAFTLINTDTQSRKQSDLIIENVLVSNPQLTALCVVCIDADGWWPNVAKLNNLTSLTLSSSKHVRNERNPSSFFEQLSHLENLRHLDVSSATQCTYPNDDVTQFVKYVESAPKLISLELGGTNLSVIVGHAKEWFRNHEFSQGDCLDRQDDCPDSQDDCLYNCMAPLEGRRFQYLGLVDCPNAPYMHICIPADKISGLHGEKQVLTALWSYQHNHGLMESVLNYMSQLLSDPEVQNSQFYPNTYIDALLAFLVKYQDWTVLPNDNQLPVSTRSVIGKVLLQLYEMLAEGPGRQKVTITQRRQLLERMLVLIDNCLRDIQVIPYATTHVADVLQLALAVLLRLPHPEDAELALRLLDSTCQYSQDIKARVGGEFELSKVKVLLYLIAGMIENYVGREDFFDKVWNFLWLLSDEVLSNCEKFVENGGTEIARKFIELYPDEYEQHWVIAGILCNVSENHELRPALCQEELVLVMRNLLESIPGDNKKFEEEGIDVTAHAAAFLVNLAADGPEAWTLLSPGRDSIMEDVEMAIDNWKIDKFRGVDFRCLSPILRYLECTDSPTAQYWACWMICNLITVAPSKYSSMLKEEGGMEILYRMKMQPDLENKVKRLVDTIVQIIEKSEETVHTNKEE